MKIVALQLPVVLGDVEKNRTLFFDKLKNSKTGGASVFILPEMWLTGFDYKNLVEHSKITDSICDEISSLLNDDELVLSSLPEYNGDKVYNTIYAVGSGGVVAKYRKNLLFSPTKEDVFISHGNNITVFEHCGVKIALHLCYEIRFPELFRQSAFLGAEIFLVPAVWPGNKVEHWQTLTRARAIENQCYLVGCNCSAMIGKKAMECGSSVAFDPWGESLFEQTGDETVLVCEIEKEKVDEIRKTIPSFNDAKDCFQIERKKP